MGQKTFLLIATIILNFSLLGQDTCSNQELGRIEFKKGSSRLTTKAKAKLDSLIKIFTSNKSCEILATSSFADFCNKCGALSLDRTKSVFDYLIHRGIEEGRLRSFSKLEGNLDFIILKITSMPLIDQVPLHPTLKEKKQSN
jgi:hypothetical protein